MKLDRRQFLGALGLGAGGLTLPSLQRGHAATQEPPKRLIVFHTNHGTWYDGWKITAGRLPFDRPSTLDLGPLTEDEFSEHLRPLHRHRHRMTLLDGLAIATGELDIAGNRHGIGWTQAWTGSWVFQDDLPWATSPSIDQLVAERIARADRLPSLELGYGDETATIAHVGPKLALPPEKDPRAAFDRVFGLSNLDASERSALDARGTVLDFAAREFENLAPQLSRDDRLKLEQHRELVRQLEVRLQGLSQVTCGDATKPPALSDDFVAAFDEAGLAQMELIASTLACDVSRVVTISAGDAPPETWGLIGKNLHIDIAHSVWRDPVAAETMTSFGRYLAGHLAYLLDLLEAIPEGDGSLLDHTLIVWGSEMGDPMHGFDDYCVTLVGGEWAFPTGRLVRWPLATTPIEGWTDYGTYPRVGVPHQHLLVEVARAMGVDVDHVGLKEVVGHAGDTVNLRGGLPFPF